MENISLVLAFSAGLVSFLSPCVLPLVPAYVGYITGTTIGDPKSRKSNLYVLYKSLGFVLGFSIIFILMGASITSIGKIFLSNVTTFRKLSGILIFIFGLHTMGIFKIKTFYREKKFLSFTNTTSTLAPIFIGMAFAAGWTPCVGPILSSILLYASNMETISKGIFLLIMYSIGLGVPFILTALALNKFSLKISKFNKYLNLISVISGVLMLIMGILIFTNKFYVLSKYLDFINI